MQSSGSFVSPAKQATPLVSVVLLSYNRPQFLEHALPSVLAQSYPRLEIIVIDNPSPQSDRIAEIVAQYPTVRLVRNAENRGFAGGMNVGIRYATGEYMYLTEDDIVVEPDCVATFVEQIENEPGEVLATGIIINHHEGTIRCAGGHVNLNGIMGMTLVGTGENDVNRYAEPYEVNFIPGAMVFARSKALRRMGGFREDFFMYLEDTELCLRALKHGYRIVVIPRARASHFEPPESSSPDYVRFHQHKNMFALYLLHAKYSVLPEFFFRYAILNLLRCAVWDRARFRLLLRSFGAVGPRALTLLRQRNALACPPAAMP